MPEVQWHMVNYQDVGSMRKVQYNETTVQTFRKIDPFSKQIL